jgi:hypothetical protein
MKILIDPMLAILAKDLSTEDKAELLMCILEYPSRDCSLGLWKYVKQQIDIDAQKYKEKCDRAAAGRQSRAALKSTLKSDMKSELKTGELDLFSTLKSAVKKGNVSKDNIIKSNCKVSVSSNAEDFVKNSGENYLISNIFSFADISRDNQKLKDFLSLYIPAVIERAQKTIIQKRFGQTLTLMQILEWLEQENQFYKQNHGGQI